jgi:hypothetical protein
MIMTGFPDPEGLAVMVADRRVGLRPCHVYDYDGEYLGSFTSWPAAHEWAHLQAAMGGVQGPLEVEDRLLGQRRRVWVDRCADLLTPLPPAGPAPSPGAHAGGQAAPGEARADGPLTGGSLEGAVLCDVLDAPTFIPAQPRHSD